MRIVKCQQGTEEWQSERLGRVTASELDALVSPTGKIRTGEGPRTYLARKLAEAWLGHPIQSGGAWAMEQGVFNEPESRAWYELTNDCEIKQVGFIVSDNNRAGCSPDGLILDGDEYLRGIEIKCPQEVAAVKYALDAELPDAYRLQVHGSMFVTGFERWEFLSYHRRLPKFTITVMRDEALMLTIGKALSEFYERFDEAFEKLNKLADEPRVNPWLATR